MRIGLYTPRVSPLIGGYDVFRIIKPVLKELHHQGHQIVLLTDIDSEVVPQFGTDTCHDWTKYLTYESGLKDYKSCDALFIVAVAWLSSTMMKQVRDIVSNFDKPIVWYDTDADFDASNRESKTPLQDLLNHGLNDKVVVAAPFKSMRSYYYDGKYKHFYFPFLYDSDEEIPIKNLANRDCMIRFAGSPAFRPYLTDGLFLINKDHPEEKMELYGSGWRKGCPGWTGYDYLKQDNIKLSNAFVYKEDHDFYEWLSTSKVGIHIAGGSSFGFVQRLLDYLYAGCLMISDYFDELVDLDMMMYKETNAGDIRLLASKILDMDNDTYVSEVIRLRNNARDKFNYVPFTNELVHYLNGGD